MRILTFTTLYPNVAMPTFGTFVQTRLQKLLMHTDTQSHVVAPVPWFPLSRGLFSRYGKFRDVPTEAVSGGIQISHPRFLAVPWLGALSNPTTLFNAAIRKVSELSRSGIHFDAIDAHYFFPDGVAAAMLSDAIGKPLVITARGSDINVHAQQRAVRGRIVKAASAASRIIAVSATLRDSMIALGMEPEKIEVIRNGVDIAHFRPVDATALLSRLQHTGTLVLAVGNLVRLKGHNLIIEAATICHDFTLVIAGDGPERGSLEALAAARGVTGRVRFLGAVSQADLPALYSAADVTVLASESEGLPNVILESLACGTPVIASDLGGVREILAGSSAGWILPERSPRAIAEAIVQVSSDAAFRLSARDAIREFSWERTSTLVRAVFESII